MSLPNIWPCHAFTRLIGYLHVVICCPSSSLVMHIHLDRLAFTSSSTYLLETKRTSVGWTTSYSIVEQWTEHSDEAVCLNDTKICGCFISLNSTKYDFVGLRDSSEVGYGVMWLPSVHADEHEEANLQKTKLSRTLVNSLPRLDLYEAGLHSMLLKTIKQATVLPTNSVSASTGSTIVLVCLSKQMKNKQCFWNARHCGIMSTSKTSCRLCIKKCNTIRLIW